MKKPRITPLIMAFAVLIVGYSLFDEVSHLSGIATFAVAACLFGVAFNSPDKR
ncbi:hypothetical protein NQ038_00395 [Brevibacterium sp. 50QC2O2]|uniref:hypothetical protein n=1 Tax=Brevibacterium sp. 50QC2O2 TaxID=2968459 RepID=UPI00211CFF06|nr:hypothetical protein [Brevibacterium sp. 50QC2O2]MCQ9387118.1 hypothetical protein [Brevibacterium sp. 50QC2O2]